MSAKPFRRRSARHSWELTYGPAMTPMVDVVMVILIFFMASATFAGMEWFLKTALPKQGVVERPATGEAGDPFRLPPARFEITLERGRDGATVATGQGFEPTPMEDLKARLEELARGAGAEDLVLVIRSNADVPYGDVIRAHDAATAAGIVKVGLMDAGG
jgi:biopolymer transport protein ExbD